MNELALFAGAGGGLLGTRLLGWRPVCAVEIDEYCRRVLMQRQDDGLLERFPIWDDVRTFDGKPWRGVVDIVTGGFPCQDISTCGKGAGIDGERSGLWREMFRVICEVRPRFAFVENSPALAFRGLERVLWDLASVGFAARWGVFSACAAGAPHARERLFLLANANGDYVRASRQDQAQTGPADLHNDGSRVARQVASWWSVQPEPCSVAYGRAGIVDELRPYGNMQVPIVVKRAWERLT